MIDPSPDRTAVVIARGQLPSGFTRREIQIPPGRGRAYDAAEWAGTLVLINRGAVELEGLDGRRSQFGAGSILHLDRLPLRYIRNDGPERAVLIAVGREVRAYPTARSSKRWEFSTNFVESKLGD